MRITDQTIDTIVWGAIANEFDYRATGDVMSSLLPSPVEYRDHKNSRLDLYADLNADSFDIQSILLTVEADIEQEGITKFKLPDVLGKKSLADCRTVGELTSYVESAVATYQTQ